MISNILLDAGIPELLLFSEFTGNYSLTIRRNSIELNSFKVPAHATSLLINEKTNEYYDEVTCDEMKFRLKEIKINTIKKSITLLLE